MSSSFPPSSYLSDSDILKCALEWQVTFWSGEVSLEERASFEDWIAKDERHATAWAKIQTTQNKLATLGRPGAGTALLKSRQSTSRRKVLRIFGLVAGIGVVASTVRHTSEWQGAMADYSTKLGERRDIVLADGSQITLNSASAIDVVFDNGQRTIRIRTGEIYVVTGPDSNNLGKSRRPLIVQTAEGHVRPIGTRFNVRQDDGRSFVAVEEGSVEINPGAAAGKALTLHAGEQTSFNDIEVMTTRPIQAAVPPWTRGLLVAERMRLRDFISEIGRYRRGFLSCDDSVANLIVSGVYSIDDTDGTLESLVEALPIRLQFVSRYWVSVQAIS